MDLLKSVNKTLLETVEVLNEVSEYVESLQYVVEAEDGTIEWKKPEGDFKIDPNSIRSTGDAARRSRAQAAKNAQVKDIITIKLSGMNKTLPGVVVGGNARELSVVVKTPSGTQRVRIPRDDIRFHSKTKTGRKVFAYQKEMDPSRFRSK